MLTIDLGRLHLKGVIPGEGLETLIAHLKNSVFFRLRLMRMARQEAERRCAPNLICSLSTELEFTIEQESLLIDIDVIGSLAEPHGTTYSAATEES